MFNYKVRLASLIREFPSFNCQVFFFFFSFYFFRPLISDRLLSKKIGVLGRKIRTLQQEKGCSIICYIIIEKSVPVQCQYLKIYIYIESLSKFRFNFGKFARYPIENSALDGINANGKLVFLSFLLFFFSLSFSAVQYF